MDKLKMMSMDKVQANIEKIRALFPNAVTEVLRDGKPTLAVDFDVLKQELASDLIDEKELRYQFTWPDKQKAILRANEPTNKTLRPCRKESVDFDTTQNLYIEGDNLEVLKLLQETYLGKIKMIYIDPPYNTGNDFVYNDDFSQDSDEYLENSGQLDEQGNRLFQNTESNGRFHTDWLNMIYPRLKVARDLLAPDGLIFISIDERELSNLLKVCNEIYSERNLVGIFKWNKTSKAPTLSNRLRNKYEYVLCYVKDEITALKGPASYNTMAPLFNSGNQRSKLVFKASTIDCNFPDGVYKAGAFGINEKEVILFNDLIVKDGVNENDIELQGRFKWSQQTLNERIAQGQRFAFKKPNFTTMYYYLELGADKFIAPSDLINMEECNVSRNDEGFKEVYDLFEFSPFNYCKPSSLIKHLITMVLDQDFIILDFFSGSATTAHAVMQLNAEDGGNRQFIMVQLPELCDKKSEAYKAGFKNICEIGKERIRRAGKKIKTDNGEKAQSLDIGFRVFKLDSSNMQDVYYKPEEYNQMLLDNLQDNIKSDRTALDLVFQIMLELGKPLSAKITQKVVAGKNVFNVDDGDLIACFEDNISAEVVTEIAKAKPLYAVFRDSGLSSDSVAANFEQIFATYSPNTKRKVL